MPIYIRIDAVEYGIDIWPLFVIALVVLLGVLWRRGHSLSYLLCCMVFGIYLLFALDKTFFPLQISGAYADSMREYGSFAQSINLVPFSFGPFGTFESTFTTLMLNVLLTIPFGFGINFILPIRAKSFIWLGFAVGLGIETAQLLISLLLRYPWRYIDVNDVLMNAVGVWIGYGLFRVFAWLYVMATERLGIRHWGLTDYVYAVASRVNGTLDSK